jgi:allantoicase
MKGQFGPNGALYSGWESRRHNPAYDWCIIKLGTPGSIHGFDIDTSHFNGNEAPQVSVEVIDASDASGSQLPTIDSKQWKELLPRVDLGPSSRHLFSVPKSSVVSYVKLNMYPDGGIVRPSLFHPSTSQLTPPLSQARFRVYGEVIPIFPQDLSQKFDLAHVFAGGKVIFTSDQHFGVGSNLILPGRGKDMGDGWETKRSRTPEHKDWVIIKLGTPGYLEYVEIDTAHFKGNFPESCELEAVLTDVDLSNGSTDGLQWTPILPRTKLGPHRQHYFMLENVQGKQFSHVKTTIHPDGGIKRIRVIGSRDEAPTSSSSFPSSVALATEQAAGSPASHHKSLGKALPALPLTHEAFSPFGQVIQAYEDNAAPRSVKITPANFNTATKYHKLALTTSSYPSESNASTGISVYRCQPVDVSSGSVPIKVLERHPHTNQAFVPMGNRQGDVRYLVVVALSSSDGQPDLGTLRAFVATGAQGIMYNTGVWHQPMTVLNQELDLTCIETQIGDGSALDCEIVDVRELVHYVDILSRIM